MSVPLIIHGNNINGDEVRIENHVTQHNFYQQISSKLGEPFRAREVDRQSSIVDMLFRSVGDIEEECGIRRPT